MMKKILFLISQFSYTQSQYMLKNNAYGTIYWPLYCPDINPVENWWGMFKNQDKKPIYDGIIK